MKHFFQEHIATFIGFAGGSIYLLLTASIFGSIAIAFVLGMASQAGKWCIEWVKNKLKNKSEPSKQST